MEQPRVPLGDYFEQIPLSNDQILRAFYGEFIDFKASQMDWNRRIEAQTTKTNGRVTLIERFMWTVTGAALVIGVIVVPQYLGLTNGGG